MSLFGYTSYFPTTSIDESKWGIVGQGYNVNRIEHQPVYAETKDKFQELYQPIRTPDLTQELKDFTDNNFSRTMHPTYGLNANYHNGVIGKVDDKPYGTEMYYPKAYPNHFFNNNTFSPVFLATLQ